MIPSLHRSRWLAQHVVPHEPALRAWLRHRAIEGLDTDDVVQETYAVLAGLPGVSHITSPRAYAFQTAQSLILRHLRRARIVRIDAIGDMEALGAAHDSPSPEQHAVARQELRHVRDVISALPEKCREAFVLRRIEGLSQRMIAHRMGISESTVEKHIGRALRALMAAMRDSGIAAQESSGDVGGEDYSRDERRSRYQCGNR